MDTPEQERAEVVRRTEELQKKGGEHLRHCHFRSASRVYGDMARLARSEQLLIPYMLGTFHQMDLALDLMEPQVTREKAVELIALLESEERARYIQPEEFPAAHYEWIISWMSACAYENLAEATGRLDGYNSEGMHGCITDGIQICHQTGKLACIRCFREYAAEVYTAADDSAMALHHSRAIACHQGDWSDRGNRRWFGSKNEGSLLLLDGRLEEAEAALQRAMQQVEEEKVSLPLQAWLRSAVEWETILLLAGKLDPNQMNDDRGLRRRRVPADEYPANDVCWQLNDALAACCRGDHAAAIQLLGQLDRWLSERRCLHDWFEVRLRLLAAHRLGEQNERIVPLARQLDTKARQARDWLTLRRLERLLDPAESVSPLALLGPLTSGLFAAAAARTALPVQPPAAEAAPAETAETPAPAEAETEATPLEALIEQLAARMSAADSDEDRAHILADVLAIAPTNVTHPLDAARLLHLLQYVLGEGERAVQIWAWAQAAARPFGQSATVLNLQAVLGDILRGAPQTPQELLTPEQLEQLFRQSLDLDANDAGNFARAGAYYLGLENMGEAERCLARGFRLRRDNGFLALRLADLYKRTDRPRDALAVVDLCLREGCQDPNVAFEAALIAFQVGQYEAQLTYLDRFEALQPDQPWSQYYRALGNLELGRLAEAEAAIAAEERLDPARTFPVFVVRACIAGARQEIDAFRDCLHRVLDIPLVSIDYLTQQGVANLLTRLWKAAQCLPADDSLRGDLEQRLLVTGTAPTDLFEQQRQQSEPQENIHYYRCMVFQPLDDRWPQSPGCLHGQETWEAYFIMWGVLARDEDEAKQRVLGWQKRCYHLPADVAEIEPEDASYTDKPGVVWQGVRHGAYKQTSAEDTTDGEE